ncbi:peptidoglycan recognition protein family protein [Nonomuraea recticatena]|uniref:N-acetylmuramoyl-L-alanine amidase n=1 Tax=Nonomuraea recticatena TaxID=46178 RepID=A0ABN3SVH7_9ACTN
MANLVTRDQWNARTHKGHTPLRERPRGVKYHYVGGRVEPDIVKDHGQCVALVKSIQRHHMDTNLWADIGYSVQCCPHREIFIGRGPGVVPAANGPGLNAQHYAILALVGDSGLVVPTDDMLHGLLDARAWLMGLREEEQPCGGEVLGHRDGYGTECPGDWLYDWIRRGHPRPGGAGSPRPVSQPPPWPGRVLEYPPLQTGDDVRTWQRQMARRGWRIDVDGRFGPTSREVARAFQKEKGFRVTGRVGRDDWRAAWLAPIT